MSGGRQGQGNNVGSQDPQPEDKREEVSGLNDIRALARTTLERQAVKHPDEGSGERQAVLESSSPAALGHVLLPAPGREVEPQLLPVAGASVEGVSAVPTPSAASSSKKIWVLGGGAVVIVAVIAAALLRGGEKAETPTAAQKAPSPFTVVTPPPTAPVEATTEAAATTAPKAMRPVPSVSGIAKAASTPPPGSTPAKAAPDTTPPAASAGPALKEAPAKPSAAPASTDDLDSLLNSAAGDTGKTKEAEAKVVTGEKKEEPSGEVLPASLTRDDVKQGMGTIRARIQVCYDRYKVPGNVTIKTRIESDGTVSSSTATDAKFSGTETGQCVADAVKLARFRRVSGPPMTLSYPFKLE
jgi:hypothetical protein